MLLQQHGSNSSFALKARARVLLLKMQTHEEMRWKALKTFGDSHPYYTFLVVDLGFLCEFNQFEYLLTCSVKHISVEV